MQQLLSFIKEGQLFLIPAAILIITQVTKVLLELPNRKNFKVSYFAHYGGMPSSHTALFVSLSTIMLLNYGWHSPYFAIAIIVCMIMVRDALGIRNHLCNHGLILKQLIHDLTQRKHTVVKHDKIITNLGHSPWQVFVGAVFGFVFTAIFYFLLN